MNNARIAHCICTIIFFIPFTLIAAPNVGGVSGSLTTTIPAGSILTPSYSVVTAGIAGEAVYSGQIESSTSTTISFESSSDSSEVTIHPFVSGVFNSSIITPILTSSLSGAGVGSIAITYAGSGFTTAPELIIDYPTSGDDQATATCTISSGAINGITITNAGSGYDQAPNVIVVGGPHFVKLTESGDDDEGRVFLITDNNETRLTLDTSTLDSSTSPAETIANILQNDFSIEVVPAATLGSVLGRTVADCALKEGKATTADFVYIWNNDSQYFIPYYLRSPASGLYPIGWYDRFAKWKGIQNDLVIYPDEGFIIGRRTNSAVSLSVDGATTDSAQKLRLPALNKQVVMNNPYGGDLLLGELIPPQYIGNGARQFRPGSSDSDNDADKLYFLASTDTESSSAWDQYHYETGYNDGVTTVATATAKAGTGGSGALQASDVSLASGTITNLQSCNSSGTLVDHNVSDHTLVTLNTANAPAVNFVVTFSGILGKKLNENGDGELDINGTSVSAGNGINIFSGLNGSYKIITQVSSSKIVVRKKRDINFDSGLGAKSWSTGQVGAGYSTNSSKKAKVYFLGGGGSGAHGTFFNGDNPKITITSGGSGYTSAPQVVITGGGWRIKNGGNSIEDNATLGATEGMIIIRRNPAGVLTYIKGANPFQ